MSRLKLLFPWLCLALAITTIAGDHFARRGAADAPGVDRDPVCGMEVSPAWGHALTLEGHKYAFCTAACRAQFAADPPAYLALKCTVCRAPLAAGAAVPATWQGRTFLLCSAAHRADFLADPAAFFLHRMWGIPPWLYSASVALVLVLSFVLFEVAGRRRTPAAAAVPTPGVRLDLLRWRPLAALLRWPWARPLAQGLCVAFFAVIIAAGLYGDPNPALNLAPILTWTVWWGGLVVAILFVGKAWCYVCPWDAIAGWLERLSFRGGAGAGLGLGLPWPRALRNILVATVLFVGLTWIELGFGVTMSPRATAWLGLGMLALAFVSAFLFERRSFCRYACLVGRVSGLYALFAGIELRARDRKVCGQCHTRDCFRGNERGVGCPTFEFPGRMDQNTYCTLCTECLRTCPHDNLALALRPWGADLAGHARPRADEAYLALLLLAITGFHGLTMTPLWGRLVERVGAATGVGTVAAFSAGMTAILLAPVALFALLVEVSRRLAGAGAPPFRAWFVRHAYCVIPIALFYHLAHNLEHLLLEGPKAARLASDPFGWGWNLFGTAAWTPPPLVALETLWFLQVALVLVGHVYSLWVSERIAHGLAGGGRRSTASQLPLLVGMILFSVFSLWLLKQPMEMRTTAV